MLIRLLPLFLLLAPLPAQDTTSAVATKAHTVAVRHQRQTLRHVGASATRYVVPAAPTAAPASSERTESVRPRNASLRVRWLRR